MLSLPGTNLERAGDYNRRIVLRAVRLTDDTTRSPICVAMGGGILAGQPQLLPRISPCSHSTTR